MISVNTNVASLNAQRNLGNAGKSLSRSLERLSSGLRINRASDDAAGLAISEGLRSQVRGLNQAVRNANDGISLLSTAESAVAETTNMLQRMRELAVQSANDVNSTSNRISLQAEVDQLAEEITRIGNTVQFNGLKLLDGSFQSKSLQIGAAANQTLDISVGDLRGSALGSIALTTSNAATAAVTAGMVTLNGVDLGSTTADGVSSNGDTYSALAMANAVNAKSSQTEVYATVLDNTKTGTGAVAGGAIAASALSINGTAIAATTVLANDSDGALRDSINAVSNTTGVVASLDASNQLVLTASDGRNIQIAGTAADMGEIGMAAADSASTTVGTYELYSDAAFTVGGTAVGNAGLTAGTVAVDANQAVNNLDISSASGAANAIIRIDNALRQVSSERSSMGAYVNRLESTVSNLQTVSENLAASDSRIRDADFASETALLTKAQILQQAGTAILAQANVTPQAALTLLG